LDARKNLTFQLPVKHMLVHKDDVNKDIHEMRFLPREELLTCGDHMVEGGVDITSYRKKLIALRVSE
jgi:hypothetical protein